MNKKIITSMLLCALLSTGMSYAQKFDDLDDAPVDISYLTTRKIPKPLVKVVYGRPQKESNFVFGEQVPYGEIWRTGANEATEVKFFTDMSFGRKLVKAGTYVLHTIQANMSGPLYLIVIPTLGDLTFMMKPRMLFE